MIRVFLALVVLLNAAAATASADFSSVSREATPAEIKAIREAMQARLKDADSAKFRNVRVIGTANELCGDVNAKNGMGAYVGFAKFNGMLLTNRSNEVVDGVAPGASAAVILAIDNNESPVAAQACGAK